jgi:hypothetical protein
MRRTIVPVALAAALLLAASPPAAADDAWGVTTCAQESSPWCQVSAGRRPDGSTSHGQRPVGGQEKNGDDKLLGCRYVPAGPGPGQETPKGPGGWFMLLCSPDGKDPDSRGPIWVPAGADAPPPSPEQVAEMARKRLRLPMPKIRANPAGEQLVNLPTWMWLDRDSWGDISATASVPGVSVTATAKPQSATWSMGDGSSVTCTSSGTPFSAGGDPKSASPDCGHTYRSSSAGRPAQAFLVSVKVQWTVTWSGAGQSGTFPNLSTTASASFRVAESQGITTG